MHIWEKKVISKHNIIEIIQKNHGRMFLLLFETWDL